jgi:ABC-type uncharacterized transport system YnjBCD ATPase subunit
MKSHKISFRNKTIYLLGTVKGLTVERKTVATAFKRYKPDVIALSVSEEDLVGLESVVKGKTKKIGLSRYEEVYARKLATIAKQDPVSVSGRFRARVQEQSAGGGVRYG